MDSINLWAVLAAAIASFMFGGLWYSPLLFLTRWCQQSGVDPATSITHPGRVYGLSFLFTLLSAFAMACLLGAAPALSDALRVGLLAGLALVATSLGINYQFANRGVQLWLIDSGFHIGRFMLIAVVLWLLP